MIHITAVMSFTTEGIKWCCGHFDSLVIICILPSGFRTVPRVALKIPEPWNAQRLCYQAKTLRMSACQPVCVTPLYHHPLSIKKYLLWALVHMHQSVSVAPVLPTDGNLRRSVGGLSMEPHPLLILASCPVLSVFSIHPPLLFHICTHQAERTASALHGRAPGPGCRQWKPPFVNR